MLRHIFERADIGSDIFSLGAVATGSGCDQVAVLVTQRHRQAVDLRLGAKCDGLVLAQFKKAADPGYKIDDVLLCEGVVERKHRHRVADFLESSGRRDANLERQRFLRPQIREARLNGVVTRAEHIVSGVRDRGPVLLIIAPVVLRDFHRQPRVLDLRLPRGQKFYGCLIGFYFRRHTTPRRQLAALISRSAAARASLVISAPASIRAISSRRRSGASSATLVATRFPFSSASLLMR